MSSTLAINDVLTEILLHLPVKFLLRFRTVCKLWRDVIDSPSFRNWHVKQNNNVNDDTVFVQFSFLQTKIWELSILFLDNGRSYNDFPPFKEFFKDYMSGCRSRSVRVVGAVKGLVCFHRKRLDAPIAICNPSLGQIKTLPLPPPCYCSCSKHSSCTNSRKVGIGFDDVAQDYKVVQLLSCQGHGPLHASVYSGRTNSWRELAGDGNNTPIEELHIDKAIKSTCQNGSFAHWYAFQTVKGIPWKKLIVSFDMRNEVFRTWDFGNLEGLKKVKIVATKESFVLFDCGVDRVGRILEAKFGRNELEWNPIKSFGPFGGFPRPKALWKTDCVILKRIYPRGESVMYDYCYQDYVGCFQKPAAKFKILEYKGSFISP